MARNESTIVALVRDRPGVLNRISSMFRRRNFNIVSLAVGQSETLGMSRMAFVVNGDDATVGSRLSSSYASSSTWRTFTPLRSGR